MVAFMLLISLVSAIIFYLWNWIKKQNSLPPGPQPLPVIGNFHQLDKCDPRNTLVQWKKKYGPLYTVWLGSDPYIFVTGYELMKEIFVTQGNLFNYRQPNFLFESFTRGKFGILNTSGETWIEQRRFALHTLRNFGVGRTIMEEKIKIETEKMLNVIYDKMKSSKNGDFSIQYDIEWCIGNIISSLVLGRPYPQSNDSPMYRIKRLLDKNAYLFSSKVKGMLLNSYNWLRFVPLFNHFGWDELHDSMVQIEGILTEEINDRKKELKLSTEPNDFTTAYLQEMYKRQKSENRGDFSDWQLICVLEDIIIAGLQTTVKTLHWAVLLMMKYPSIQQKVHEEIDAVITENRLPSMSDRMQMPYTNAVINEIQRFANIIPFNFARIVKETVTINGYTLPKGAAIVPQIATVHFDEDIFNNPREFIPERFLEGDQLNLKKCEQLIPFSLGKRNCLGESLARTELFLIFASLMQKFNFSIPNGESSPSLSPGPGFSLGPQQFNCNVQMRAEA